MESIGQEGREGEEQKVAQARDLDGGAGREEEEKRGMGLRGKRKENRGEDVTKLKDRFWFISR